MTHYTTATKFISIAEPIPFSIFSKVIDFMLKHSDTNLTKISLDRRIVWINGTIDVINFTLTDGYSNYTYYKKACWKEVGLNVFSKI